MPFILCPVEKNVFLYKNQQNHIGTTVMKTLLLNFNNNSALLWIVLVQNHVNCDNVILIETLLSDII